MDAAKISYATFHMYFKMAHGYFTHVCAVTMLFVTASTFLGKTVK